MRHINALMNDSQLGNLRLLFKIAAFEAKEAKDYPLTVEKIEELMEVLL